MKKYKSSRGGFSLVEIMIVIAIIVVLAGAVILKAQGNLIIAKKIQVGNDITAITTQLRTYELYCINLPTTEQGLEALVSRPNTPPVPRRWESLLPSIPLDPWGTPYGYLNPGTRNSAGFDLYSLGPDKKDGTEDDIGNWETP